MSVETLRPLVRQLARIAEEHVYAYVITGLHTADDLAVSLPEITAPYIQSAALLAADWYQQQDDRSRYRALPFDGIPEDRILATSEWVFAGPQLPENRARVAAHAMVFDAARNTVVANAESEGVAIARHEMADACDRCAARATTSVRTRESGSDTVPRDFHHSCEGMFVPVRRGVYQPPDHASEWGRRKTQARRSGAINPDDIAKFMRGN